MSTSGPLLVSPAPWIVAVPLGALALEMLPMITLLAIVGGTVPPKKKPTAAIAAASWFGEVTVVALPAMRTLAIVAFASASIVPGPLGPLASLDRAVTVRRLPSIRLLWTVSGTLPQAQSAASAPKACPSGVFTRTEFSSSSSRGSSQPSHRKGKRRR